MLPADLPDVVAQMPDRSAFERFVRQKREQIRKNPLRYSYPPNAMQEAFLASDSRHKIVVAANRVGKTDAAMRDTLWRARGEHPYRKVRSHGMIWVGSPDYPSYQRYHKPAFDRWCPPSWIVGQFNNSEKWVDIRRIDGGLCRIFFLSYDMDRSKWQGAGVDHIWPDEEMPEDLFGECVARIVTTRGSITLTFTPVEGVGWWYDRIYAPAVRGENHWRAFTWPLAEYDEGNPADFFVGRPKVTHLTREQIIEFAREYPDPDEQAIRIFGQVKSRRGLVYKSYAKEVHVVPAFRVPEFFELWGGIDPGYHGFAVVIGAIAPDGSTYVLAEMFSQQQTTKARFKAVMDIVRGLLAPVADEEEADPVVVAMFVDTEDPQVVLELNTLAQEAAAEDEAEGKRPVILAFASLDQGLKARKAGFLRIQQLLAQDPRRETPAYVRRPKPEGGEPQLYFIETLYSEWQGADRFCRESRVLWEIERYSWKKPPPGKTQMDDADEASAAGAHAMAAFRYFVMARLGPSMKPEEDKLKGLDGHSRAAWEEVEDLESRQLEEMGLL